MHVTFDEKIYPICLMALGLIMFLVSFVHGRIKLGDILETTIDGNPRSRVALQILGLLFLIIGALAYFDFWPKKSNFPINVRVETPKDDLGLRSEPSDISGTRLHGIPHGTLLQIYDCQSMISRDERSVSGHWCKCKYRNMEGWIFDAYVTEIKK